MKRKKAQVEKTSVGTTLGVKLRTESNRLTDTERARLGDEFMKAYYGGDLKPATAHRR